MRRAFLTSLAIGLPIAHGSGPPSAPIVASASATLPTAGEDVRQLAFDGDEATFFASEGRAGAADHFTLTLDSPAKVTSVAVLSGRGDGADALDRGTLQVSGDGATFDDVAPFERGRARADLGAGRPVRAIRVKPGADLGHPLAIREVAIASEPAIATFRDPVEFVVDVTDAPEMKGWAEEAALACERAYPMICDELRGEGPAPARLIRMTLKSGYKGVAAASGTRITGSAKFFKDHPDDLGAMVHETAHVVQRYRGRDRANPDATPNPSWLVEGVADYVRFFKYEPGKIGRIDPGRARHDAGYRATAAFLAYVAGTYDKDLVRELNRAMRRGAYREEIFRERTGKPLGELGAEWKATLGR